MRISLKLSIAFCVAAMFLLLVEVTAVLIVVRLNEILDEVNHHNVQLDQVGIAARAYRLAPEKTAEHLARLSDLEKWATSDDETRRIADLRQRLASGRGVEFAQQLDDLSAHYRKANDAAHDRLITIHERVVFGLFGIMITSILLFTLLTYLVRAWLLNPVRKLGERLARIAAGEWDLTVLHRSDEEFQQVVKPINALLTARRELQERIERAEQLAVLGEACSHVTHNVRNQLAAIRSLAQYESKTSSVDREARVGFNYIIATVNKLDTWLRDLHGSVQPLAPRPAVQHIEPIIQDTLAMLEPRFTERGVTAEFKPADRVPAVPVDRSFFEQALAAILTNALEASTEVGRVAITTAAGPDGAAIVCVEDHGVGMPDEVRQRAFEPFFTTKPDGAGLGLTIAQWVVKRHGGVLELDTTPKKGTRVTLRLPAAKQD